VKKPTDYSERRDVDPKRMNKFRQELGKAKKAWFDDVYGNDQLNLLILATHPEYRRLGAAARLVAWGQEQAKAEGIPVTVFSSPMGFPLYRKWALPRLVPCTFRSTGMMRLPTSRAWYGSLEKASLTTIPRLK
jgi:GNAT superfamily N-acetyltransferase